jgi:hypothetical protein
MHNNDTDNDSEDDADIEDPTPDDIGDDTIMKPSKSSIFARTTQSTAQYMHEPYRLMVQASPKVANNRPKSKKHNTHKYGHVPPIHP